MMSNGNNSLLISIHLTFPFLYFYFSMRVLLLDLESFPLLRPSPHQSLNWKILWNITSIPYYPMFQPDCSGSEVKQLPLLLAVQQLFPASVLLQSIMRMLVLMWQHLLPETSLCHLQQPMVKMLVLVWKHLPVFQSQYLLKFQLEILDSRLWLQPGATEMLVLM